MTFHVAAPEAVPNQTSHVAPAMVTVAWRDPIGWIEPVWLSHTITSAPSFCPVDGVGWLLLNHRSYAASYTPEAGYDMSTLVVMLANRLSVACIGSWLLPSLQVPQWQPA